MRSILSKESRSDTATSVPHTIPYIPPQCLTPRKEDLHPLQISFSLVGEAC
jgi:hypothetical protein